MFGNLSDRLQSTISKLRGTDKLTEENIKEALREVKLALLEADVNLLIVKEFVNYIKKEVLGSEVEQGLDPGKQFIKLVHEKLVEIMGTNPEDIQVKKGSLHKVMMVGLQGSGKTTTTGKIAKKFQDVNPLLVACDVYRPAAVDQLLTIAKQAGVASFEKGTDCDPVEIAKEGLEKAKLGNHGLLMIDTAGRLQVDEKLMDELARMKEAIQPDDILLVIDSMTGQEAVRVAKTFDEILGITGVVLTKVDGDARGGAALSIRKTIGKPIKYIGIGEKLDGIELFDPERMASRILGMGDVIGLIEKASMAMDEKTAKRLQRRMGSGDYNLVDFLQQLEMMKKMGPMEDLLKMIPGMSNMSDQFQGATKEMGKTLAIIQSMTTEERYNPNVLNASRRRRIAKGSGTTVQQINQLLRQFEQMKQMMKQFKKMGLMNPSKLMGGMGGKLPFKF
ncbi:MAG: signal recognition particle protein [Candidatus Cloacimonadota bacterium]|nr:MAG: signal recognition particle protein [Candidatus Cloacimonadota bacterium]